MLQFAIGFFSGWLTISLFQTLLSINSAYKIWKMAELAAIKIMADNEQWRHQSLTILKLCYEEAEKLEQYQKIELVINEKHKTIQKFIIKNLKSNLPYGVEYETLEQAVKANNINLSKLQQKENGNE